MRRKNRFLSFLNAFIHLNSRDGMGDFRSFGTAASGQSSRTHVQPSKVQFCKSIEEKTVENGIFFITVCSPRSATFFEAFRWLERLCWLSAVVPGWWKFGLFVPLQLRCCTVLNVISLRKKRRHVIPVLFLPVQEARFGLQTYSEESAAG